MILREKRQREIDAAYARGYGRHPQEDWVGELGLAGLTALQEAEGGKPPSTIAKSSPSRRPCALDPDSLAE